MRHDATTVEETGGFPPPDEIISYRTVPFDLARAVEEFLGCGNPPGREEGRC